jgi:hypothetical protein
VHFPNAKGTQPLLRRILEVDQQQDRKRDDDHGHSARDPHAAFEIPHEQGDRDR